MNKSEVFIEEHRNLSVKEVDLIKWLLVTTNNLQFVEQIENAKVVSKCGCGCHTIDLQVEGYEAEAKPSVLNLSAQGLSPENVPVDVVLHVRHGLISELEVYALDGTEEFDLPKIDTLNIS
jgi:hypothetical protein